MRKAANAKKEKDKEEARVVGQVGQNARPGKKRVRGRFALDKLEKRIMGLEEELGGLHEEIAKEDGNSLALAHKQ